MLASLRANVWNGAAFFWGVAEATLFFIVPDVLLSYIGLRHGARLASIASLYAALGAGIGGAIMYLWSTSDPAAALAAVLAVPAISASMVANAQRALGENWFSATLLGPLSVTPYKVFAVLVPQAGAPLPIFAGASVIARLPRFLIVSLGVAAIRRWLEPRFARERLTWALAAAWTLFYALFFAFTPG